MYKMPTKKMAFMFVKAVVVIFVLCFAYVHLAAIKKIPKEDESLDAPRNGDNREEVPRNGDNHEQVPRNGDNHEQVPRNGDNHEQVPRNGDNHEQVPHHLQREEDSLQNKEQVLIEPVKQDRLNVVEDHNVVKQVQEPGADSDVDGHVIDRVQENLVENQDFIRGDIPPQKQPQLEKPDEPDNVVVDFAQKDSQIEEPKQKVDIVNAHPMGKDDDNDGDADEGEEDDEDEEEEEEDDEFPAHRLVNVNKLSLNELQPPDHMDGVRLEQDGHLNRDFKKEIILGNHEEFEQQGDVDQEEILETIFNKVDEDGDSFVTLAELEKWIIAKVAEHFQEANEEAERIFKHLDANNKGTIQWKDFHIHFLVAKGHDPKVAKKHAADYETIPLDPDEKERLIRYKFRWAEADEEPQDNKLTLQEFRAFRHPEQSATMLNRMVQDIIENLDQNNDGEVTEEEFIALPPGEVDGQFVESDKAWQEERRQEFRNVIDINHNSKITRDELKNYVDPQNPNHARLEAENLIQLADDNNDDKLSLDEVLDNPELFLGSKMVDTGKNFHDEF